MLDYETAVVLGVISEGSVDKVLDGKQYNRRVRLHKLEYKSLIRRVLTVFRKAKDQLQSTSPKP
jgi:hypothetical protein